MAQDAEGIELMTTTTYNVRGMTCGHCAASVTAEVRTIPGVTEVAVDVPAGLVISSDAQVSTSAVNAAVVEAGFEAVKTGDAVVGSCCGGSTCSTSSNSSAQ